MRSQRGSGRAPPKTKKPEAILRWMSFWIIAQSNITEDPNTTTAATTPPAINPPTPSTPRQQQTTPDRPNPKGRKRRKATEQQQQLLNPGPKPKSTTTTDANSTPPNTPHASGDEAAARCRQWTIRRRANQGRPRSRWRPKEGRKPTLPTCEHSAHSSKHRPATTHLSPETHGSMPSKPIGYARICETTVLRGRILPPPVRDAVRQLRPCGRPSTAERDCERLARKS